MSELEALVCSSGSERLRQDLLIGELRAEIDAQRALASEDRLRLELLARSQASDAAQEQNDGDSRVSALTQELLALRSHLPVATLAWFSQPATLANFGALRGVGDQEA